MISAAVWSSRLCDWDKWLQDQLEKRGYVILFLWYSCIFLLPMQAYKDHQPQKTLHNTEYQLKILASMFDLNFDVWSVCISQSPVFSRFCASRHLFAPLKICEIIDHCWGRRAKTSVQTEQRWQNRCLRGSREPGNRRMLQKSISVDFGRSKMRVWRSAGKREKDNISEWVCQQQYIISFLRLSSASSITSLKRRTRGSRERGGQLVKHWAHSKHVCPRAWQYPYSERCLTLTR